MLDVKKLPYKVERGEKCGVVVSLDYGEKYENEFFDWRYYNVKDLNQKSKRAIGILFDILRSHISVDGETHERKFNFFTLPLVVSKDFSPADFFDLWTTTAMAFYASFGYRLAWDMVDSTAKNVGDVLDPTETVDYKTVQIYECNDGLFECLYSDSLVSECGHIYVEDTTYADLAEEKPSRLVRESSKKTAEKSKAKKQSAEEKAEKAEAEATADWNKKASEKIVDHLIGKYFKGKNNDFKTTLEKEIQNILNGIK